MNGSAEPLPPAVEARIRRHLEDAENLARRIGVRSQRYWASLDVDDLLSTAREALVLAARRYDPASGAVFWGYARPRIAGAVYDVLRRHNRGVRQHRRALARLEQEQRALDALTAEASEALKKDVRARVEAAAKLVEATVAGIVARKASALIEETTPDDETDPERATIRAELLDRLRRALDTLDAEDRALYRALYEEQLSASAYAKATGVAPSTITRRHARLLRRLGAALAAV